MQLDAAGLQLARHLASLPEPTFAEGLLALSPEEQDEALRLRFRFDRANFARWCWPERFGLPFNACHLDLLQQDRGHYTSRTTVRSAVAAPRGLGKSTIASFVDPIWGIVYDLERMIVLFSAEKGLAVELTEDLRGAFTAESGPLQDLYGPFTVAGGKSDFTVGAAGAAGTVRVLARSFGTPARGPKHDGERPTLIIVDDGERSDRVNSPEQRRKWRRFLYDDIGKMGRKEGGTAIHVRGTVLHSASLLAELLDSPAWTGGRWKSMIAWPERQDLWDRCRRIWADLSLGEHRRAAARAFYEANRAEMDRGAVVLDPVGEPLFALYEIIWAEGLASFLREKNNDPSDPTGRLFDAARFARCRVETNPRGERVIVRADGSTVPLAETRRLIRWDPALGLPDGDFAALVALARDTLGYTFVLESWLAQRPPAAQLTALWSLAERWGIKRASLESNGFQRLVNGRTFREEKARRKLHGAFWQLQIVEEASSENKAARISAMEPDLANGWVQFNGAAGLPPELARQYNEFPNCDHDDGPDAVEGGWVRLGGSPVSMGQTRIR